MYVIMRSNNNMLVIKLDTGKQGKVNSLKLITEF